MFITVPPFNFNPRSPHGERRESSPFCHHLYIDFNPRSPHGERPTVRRWEAGGIAFQPTLPARGATSARNQRTPTGAISTHAPRTGSDSILRLGVLRRVISTHAPRTGSDTRSRMAGRTGERFQPTLPARGATAPYSPIVLQMLLFQPTLPARGATRRSRTTESSSIISTHAPRTGSDTIQILQITLPVAFQPTLPARGATRWLCALLGTAADFNPRSPHGERPWRWGRRHAPPGI